MIQELNIVEDQEQESLDAGIRALEIIEKEWVYIKGCTVVLVIQ